MLLKKNQNILDISSDYHKKVALKVTVKFVSTILICEVGYVLLNLLFLIIMGTTNLDTTKAFIAFKPFMIPMMIVVSIILCGYIAYRFMLQPLAYLDELAEAAKQLTHPTQAPIVLSSDLKNIEDDLNSTREQTLFNLKAAQESERRKDDLLIYLAHDLKTPLTSVMGYLKLIEDEPEISKELIVKYVRIAYKKSCRLEELINDFFEITRFKTSELCLEPILTNFSRMLTQISYEFNPILAEKELEWDLQIEENIELLCDPYKLERIIDNLIQNAVSYSFKKTTILFSLEQKTEGVRVCIQNKGNTIPPDKLSHIFEQFYRIDTARGTDTGKAGLGLAIAKEFIELHGGEITVSSEDETTRFVVEIPSEYHKIV